MAKTKISGIPTFSVNNTEKVYSDGVQKMLVQLEQGKPVNADYLTDMFFKIIDKNEVITDISAYSKQMDKLAMLKRSTASTVSLLSPTELQGGYKGVIEADLPVTFDSMENLSSRASLVTQFISIRENLYYVLGVDIYRLLELIQDGDSRAVYKLNLVKTECPELEPFLYEVLTTPGILLDIENILA